MAAGERAFLGRLGGDCTRARSRRTCEPAGRRREPAHARAGGFRLDGAVVVRAESGHPSEQAEAALGARVAEAVLKAGGAEILDGLAGVSE